MTPKSPHTTVLLIGASRGLGLAMAEEYLNHGSRVVATVRSAQRTELHDLPDTAAGRLEIEHIDITVPSTSSTCTTASPRAPSICCSSTPALRKQTPRTPSPTSQPRSSPGLWSPTR